MAQREVKVIINGEEHVSEAAARAESGLSGFVGSAKSLLAGLGAAAAALALGEFFKKAVEEAQNSREAMGQLALAVNNSGASFERMRPQIEATLDKLARMTKFQDDDFARAMQQMTVSTGDAKWSLNNLGLVADLAAAKNIDLATAADVLSKAHEGNTKMLFRLMPDLKGAANYMDLLAQATAGAAEAQQKQVGPFAEIKKQYSEFAEAVGRAMLGNDEFSKSGFGVADMLGDLGKWIDSNKGSIDKLIDAAVMIARNLWNGLAPVVSYLADILGTVLKPALNIVVSVLAEASFAVRALGAKWEDVAGTIIEATASIVEKGARVLHAFGITVADGLATTLRDYGRAMQTDASRRWTDLETDHKAFWQKMKGEGDNAVNAVKEQEATKTRVVKESLDDQKAFWDAYNKALKTLMGQLKDEMENYKERIKTLNPIVREGFKTVEVDAFNKSLQDVKKAADDAFAAIKQHGTLPPVGDRHLPSIKAVSENLLTAARTTLDWGDTFGVLDDKTKNALNSVINLASALPKALAGDFTSIAGVLGAFGSLVTGVTAGDAERRKLLDANTKALDKLRTDGVTLSNKASGESIGSAKELFTGSFMQQLGALASDPNHGDVKAMNFLNAGLAKMGLRVSDLDKIAADLGLNIRDKNGNLDFGALFQLVQGLQTPGFGTSIGQGFGDQLKFFRESQGLSGATGAQAGKDLLTFLRDAGGVSALNGIDFSNPTAAISALTGLRAQLNNGGLDPSKLGKLTGSQFNDLLIEVIGMLGTAPSSTGSGSTGTTDVPGVGTVPDASGDTVLSVLKAQSDATASYYDSSLGFMVRIADATERTADAAEAIYALIDAFAPVAVINERLDRERVSLASTLGIGGAF